MGTRGAVGFKLDEKFYVSYNHFDSYPKGLGAQVVRFCKEINQADDWENLASRVRNVKLVDNDIKPTKEEIAMYLPFANLSVSHQTTDDWYCLLRDLQNGEILWGIYKGVVSHMIDNFNFLADSLFCEYAYIINLDEMTLDFYEGFNKPEDHRSPPAEYPDNGLPFPMIPNEDGYLPCKLRVKFQMNKLPSNWLK